MRFTVKHISGQQKGRFHDLLNVETAFSVGGRLFERRWKLPASSQYSFLGKQKGLISEEIKPFIMRLVEISGIEPLTS